MKLGTLREATKGLPDDTQVFGVYDSGYGWSDTLAVAVRPLHEGMPDGVIICLDVDEDADGDERL